MTPDMRVDSSDSKGVAFVHDRLREDILTGILAPGEEVSQVRVARNLGVSRTPLREALRLLQREGLVEGEPHRRMKVAKFSIPDMESTYVARILLESVAVRATVPLLEPEDLSHLEAEMTRMAYFANECDFDRWEVPHRAFHRRLVAGAGERLLTLIDQLSDHSERYRRLHSNAGRMLDDIPKEHRGIVDACKHGDGDLAAAALARHLSNVVLDLIAERDPDYVAKRLAIAVNMAQVQTLSQSEK